MSLNLGYLFKVTVAVAFDPFVRKTRRLCLVTCNLCNISSRLLLGVDLLSRAVVLMYVSAALISSKVYVAEFVKAEALSFLRKY